MMTVSASISSGRIECGSVHQREAKAIALRRSECQRDARQCPRHIRRSLNERRAAIARA